MSETFTFKALPTDSSAPLQLSVWINDVCCFEPTVIDKELVFSHNINDNEDREHNVRIVLSGKTDEHTKIDEHGNIVKDALIIFKNFEILGIDIDTVVHKEAKYRHNHNGHSDEVEQTFSWAMGCNGTVEFKFTSPIYIWLLEHL